MATEFYVNVTDHTSVPAPDDERVGPFYRYEDAEEWIEKRSEEFVEHLSEQYQNWLEAQEGDTPPADDTARVERDAGSGKTMVYDASGSLAATYTVEDEEGDNE